jgi:hypothetical protein
MGAIFLWHFRMRGTPISLSHRDSDQLQRFGGTILEVNVSPVPPMSHASNDYPNYTVTRLPPPRQFCQSLGAA